MPSIDRVLDASANRAREALRVMEDAARFLLDHAELSASLKGLRHDLTAALRGLPALGADRDAAGDVGTAIATDGESKRTCATEVVEAASGRLSEALRSLEEYSKLLPEGAEQSAGFEKLRYRGYDLAMALHRALGADRPRQWRVCLLLTRGYCEPLGWERVLDEALDAGVEAVQVREKALPTGELLRQSEAVMERVKAKHGRVAVVINDRPDVALLVGADGVHVGQGDMPAGDVRRLVGRQLVVGVSTSRLEEAESAHRAGADNLGVGPMFLSQTKVKDTLAGPAYLRDVVRSERLARMPHLAIGGITPENVGVLVDVGVRGIAVSSCVCRSSTPGKVMERLVRALPAAHATQA
ncbi:MAG: thiamine phosphate synthase [Planctomycetota bacterium]